MDNVFIRRMTKLIGSQMEPGDKLVYTYNGTSNSFIFGAQAMLCVGEQALYCFHRAPRGGSNTAVVQAARYEAIQGVRVSPMFFEADFIARDGVPSRMDVRYERDSIGRRRFHDALQPRVPADRWHE